MSIFHWILLLIVAGIVGAAYWFLRSQSGHNPWDNMDDPDHVPGLGEPEEPAENEQRKRPFFKLPKAVTKKPTEHAEPDVSQARPQESIKPPTQTAENEEQAASAAPVFADTPPNVQAPLEAIKVRPPAKDVGKVFKLHVKRADASFIDGPDIHRALENEGLKFGPFEFYHRVTDEHEQLESVYCVTNMVQPGILDPVDRDHLSTPGLSFFLALPGPSQGVRAMHDMMETAHKIAQQVDGQVYDDKHSILNAQAAQYILDEIAVLDRKAYLQQQKTKKKK